MFQCESCKKIFARKENLTYHLEKKKYKCTEEKIYKCNVCGKEFSTKSNFVRHVNRTSCCNKQMGDQTEDQMEEEIQKRVAEQIEKIMKEKIDMINDKTVSNTTNNTTNNITNNNGNNNNNNNINNNNINSNNTNNINCINMIQYVTNNYPNAKNLEDCAKMENVTKEMFDECKNMYFFQIAMHLIKELCGTEETERPLHCTDSSRNNYIYKTQGNWKVDSGGSQIKKHLMPIIDETHVKVHCELAKEFPNDTHYQETFFKEALLDAKNKNYAKGMNNIKSLYLAKNIDNIKLPRNKTENK